MKVGKSQSIKRWRLALVWRLALAWLLVASLLAGLVQPGIGGGQALAATDIASDAAALSGWTESASDSSGHWAEETLARWQGLGLINGFADGSLRPDQAISRVEFVALANRIFAYQGISASAFSDVPGDAWFAPEVRAAVSAGYVSGFPDGSFKPHQALARVEAAAMLARLVPVIESADADALGGFADQDSVPAYGRSALAALIASGYVKGFADGTVRPGRTLTRAEAVVLLDRVLQGSSPGTTAGGVRLAPLTVTQPGIYGPADGLFTVAGDLVVDAAGVTLRNLVVKGDLTISETVGEGDVFLERVTVNGSTAIQGGGENSIHIDDSTLGAVVIDKQDGRVRVVVGGTTVIEQMDVQSGAIVEANGAASTGIRGIEISASGAVTLSGAFADVTVTGEVKLTVAKGTIARLVVAEGLGAPVIELSGGVKVASLELHSATNVSGSGEIAKALLDAPGIVFETKPKAVETTGRAGDGSGASSGNGGNSGNGAGGSAGGGGGSNGGGTGGGNGGGVTPQPPITVTVGVSEATASGFRLTLSPAVPGLGASAIAVTDASGQRIVIASAATLTGGSAYRVAAQLREEETYTVRLTLSGYAFGSPVVFDVPATPLPDIAVTASVRDISAAGFTVALSPAVPGMTASQFALSEAGSADAISITDVATTDHGATYTIAAALEEGKTYTLSTTRSGYRFGSPLTVFVPITDPEIVAVTVALFDIAESGFKVTLSAPVAGLTVDSFTLTDDRGGVVAIGSVTEADGGSAYTLAATLAAGIVYTLELAKSGYSFGASSQFSLPGEQAIIITPTAANVSIYGFLLSVDQAIADLDALNLELQDADGGAVSIDMLSSAQGAREYEVWATLAKDRQYSLSLDKEGYAFSAPALVQVQPVEVATSLAWVTRAGFQLTFDGPVFGLTSQQFRLTDPAGESVDIDGFQLAADGKSVVVTAELGAAGSYAYQFETAEARHAEGAVIVPEAIKLSKYTTFDGFPGAYTGLTVHLEQPAPGLPLSAFRLTNAAGDAIVLDAVSAADGGSAYTLMTSELNGSGAPFKLDMVADGYDFGAQATLVNATLNLWNAGRAPTQFMAGLNPYVDNLTKDNFAVKDTAGRQVEVIDAYYDPGYRLYIVTFAGTGGLDYYVSAHADGYDFGAPKKIHVYGQTTVGEVSYDGFTLALAPSTLINTEYGFQLRTTAGQSCPIQSVDNLDGVGGLYRINARLAPGAYFLRVDANLDSNNFYVNVPLIATMAVDQVTDSGLSVTFDYAVGGLSASSFVLAKTDEQVDGAPRQIALDAATTADQGKSYRLSARLAAGSYNLKLSSHLPEGGVSFQVGNTTDAGATAVSSVSAAGFTLAFEHAVPGLLPANLDIRDAQDNKLGGVKLTTSDGGLTYRVSVALSTGAQYTVRLHKDYIVFDTPIALHVKPMIRATVTDVTSAGRFILTFDRAFPEIANYLGLSITDPDGQIYRTNYFQSADHGASYEVRVPNQALKPGIDYTIRLDHELYAMEPVGFAVPGMLGVVEAGVSGLKVEFDVPVSGLTKANFAIRSSTGESFVVSSAATTDGGATYTIAAALAAGRTYTLQYKPSDLRKSVDPVPFAVVQLVTAALSDISTSGMKVTFSARVPNLQPLQLVLSYGGARMPTDFYTLRTTDGGLSYQITFVSLFPDSGYTLDLAREEYKLAAPAGFGIPVSKNLKLLSATDTRIAVDAGVVGLAAQQFALYNAGGQRIAVTVTETASGLYMLTGAFDINQRYTLRVTDPSYTFAPLVVGFKIEVTAFVFGSQSGFKLLLWPGVDGLTPADLMVTDDAGGTVAVTDVQTADAGWTYYAKAPLASGKQYHVAIADQGPYTFKLSSDAAISLHTTSVTVDRLTLQGFRLVFDTSIYLTESDIRLMDEDGQAVQLRAFYSSDGGLTYAVDATLAASKRYTLAFDKFGYDFGGDIPLSVRTVQTTFEGMESGNNDAFTLRFDQAVPGLKPSDFTILRYGQRAPLPVLDATTEDNGYTYRIESSFWGSETVTVLPSRNGYDFGAAVRILVPVIVSPAVLRVGGGFIDIGFNPAVPHLDPGDFIVKDSTGATMALTSAEAFDGSLFYRLSGPFVGGETYTILPRQTGYDFGRESLTVALPRAVVVEAAAIDESGMTLLLTPGISGLGASSFTLRDGAQQLVSIEAVEEIDHGTAYRISTELMAGAAYTLTVTAGGYQFGSPLRATVPVPISFTYAGVSTNGLAVQFANRAIPLTASSFKLVDEQGRSIPVASIEALDGGAGYALQASLPHGHRYTLSIAASGYDFGPGSAFAVKQPVAATVRNAMLSGFTLHLNQAVHDLTAAHLSLKDAQGRAILIDALTASSDGLTYKANAKLIGGETYSLAISSPRVDFGPALAFEAQQMIELALSGLGTTGFDVAFSEPVPGLETLQTALVSEDDASHPVRWVVVPGSGNTRYRAQVTIAPGVMYTLTITGEDRAFEAPAPFVMPIAGTSTVTAVSDSGIAIRINRAEADLAASDIELFDADGDRVSVAGVLAGETAGTYTVQASLAQGSTYSLRIHKPRYNFGAAASVYVPYQVSAQVTALHEGGLTVRLSMPVAGLDVRLIDTASGSDYAGRVTTPDQGLTYVIEAAVSYNRAFTLKLSKPGYVLGGDLPVNNVSAPPQVVSAVTSTDGKSITLTFDKQLSRTDGRSVFSVKINGQWQSEVLSRLAADNRQIVLTWTGRVIDENATVALASSGVNRVYGVNKTFMAPFEETDVANVATMLGMVESYVHRDDIADPARAAAQILRQQYSLTPTEAAGKLYEGGFQPDVLFAAVIREYSMEGPPVAELLVSMHAEPHILYEVYRRIPAYDYDRARLVRELSEAGYTSREYGPVLQRMALSSRNAAIALKQAGVSAEEAAQMLRSSYQETSSGAVTQMKSATYAAKDIAAGVSSVYALDVAEVVEAMAEGGLTVQEIAAIVQSLYSKDAVTNAELLVRAGFDAAAIGGALAQLYSYENEDDALDVFLGAGFSAADAYRLLRDQYPREALASGLLGRGYGAREIGDAIRQAADGAGVLISAMKDAGDSDRAIAQLVQDIWLSSGADLSDILQQFAANGYTHEQRAALLREAFGTDVAEAASALGASLDYSTRGKLYPIMLAGGYEPAKLMFYFMKNGVHPHEVYRQFKAAGMTTVDALQSVYDAKAQDGAPLGLDDAMAVLLSNYNRPPTALEAIAAVKTVFAQDASVTLDAVTLAATASNHWAKLDIAKAIQDQLGMTLKEYVDLQGSGGFSTFGCPCAAITVVREAPYLFSGVTIQELTAAMSLSEAYSLRDVVAANFDLQDSRYGRDRNAAAPYVMAALKNAGYAFEEVAAEFERLSLNGWIAAFYKNGIAAGDVAAYLRGQSVTAEDTVVRLAPYPLKDRALVLREIYSLDAAATIAVLTTQSGEDHEDIGRAVAWAYGADPIGLWVQTLRSQGGTATSVMNTILARYPSYRDAGTIGPILIQAGFSQDEVLEAMITIAYRYYGVVQLKDTIRVLQSLYAQQQITIGKLLQSASLTSPQSGIDFLSGLGYQPGEIAGALKDHYGLTSGEASALLVKQYPNDKRAIVTILASLYGQNLSTTMAESLEAAGMTTAEPALDYLRYEGFGIEELAVLFKDRFGWSVDQTAAAFSQRNMGGTKNVLVTAIAAAYELPVEKVAHAMLVSTGIAAYASAISWIYHAPFNLATSVRIAKDGYGVSSGEALKALLASGFYPESNVIAAVAQGYGASQRASIVDSLTSNGFDTLSSAVAFLGRMGFGPTDIVRVGKEHYQLTAGGTAAELAGLLPADEIQRSVAYVYGQTMTQTMLDTLTAAGKPEFSDGIQELLRLLYPLPDIVLAGRDYYKLSPGQAIYALLEAKRFATAEILAAIAEYYGKPIAQSVETVLEESGIQTIGDAALLMQSMGYSLRDVIEISRTYYGNTSQATFEALTALGFEDEAMIEWTVRNVYGEASGGASDTLAPLAALEKAGITDGQAAVEFLWNAGYSALEIAQLLKAFHGKTAAEAAGMLLATSSIDPSAVLYSMNAVYGSTYDEAMIEAFKRPAIFDSAEKAAQMLSGSGYRMTYIAETLKLSYGKTFAQTEAILTSLGLYSASAVQSTVSHVYDSVSMSSGALGQVLQLYGIQSSEAAIVFLKEQGVPVLDIVQYLKDTYELGADEATELLVPYYPGSDLGLAIVKTYYSDNSIRFVTQVISGDGNTPASAVNAMKGKFVNVDIALALKVMFRLDALAVTDAMTNGAIPAEAVRTAVAEVFGEDPLFAYLKRMKDKGKTAYDIAAELNQRGLLEANPSGVLVDLLLQLDYDKATILNVRYLYYNTSLRNEGTEQEQGTQLAQLGVTSPKEIVTLLGRWSPLAYKVITIVRVANPNATLEEIALAMKGYGHWTIADIMGGLSAVGEKPSSLAPRFKRLGLSAREAMNYSSDLSTVDMVRNLIANGYPITDYFRYISLTGVNASEPITVFKEAGHSARELAKLMSQYHNLDFYRIAKVLYDGGFTSIRELGDALLAANNHKLWIIYYLDEIGGWTHKQIAQELLDGELLSMVELVGAIRYANGNRLDDAYRILKDISTKQRQSYYDALDSVSRKLLSNNDIAVLVVISTLRHADVSLTEIAEQLLRTEGQRDLMGAIKILAYAGFNGLDIVSTIWDVYRDIIGAQIIKTMMAKAAGSYIAEFKQYYTMITHLYRIVNLIIKIAE